MKVLCLVDKFKGSMSSKQIGQIIKQQLNNKNIEVDYYPISDGGDGFLQCIQTIKKINKVYCIISHPILNIKIKSYFLFDRVNKIAYIESAKAIGLVQCSNCLNIKKASSKSLGEMINKAISLKASKIIIGLGGTATNDIGLGMLQSLGFEFKDKNEQEIENIKITDISKICSVKTKDVNVKFEIISDVTNVLAGANGATFQYGKQKGASDSQIIKIDEEINDFADEKYKNEKFSGAAGGLGYAFLKYLNANAYLGIDFILSLLKYDDIYKQYDVIITGEGCVDNQSLNGKVIDGIIKRSKGSKIIIICGINKLSMDYFKGQDIYIYSLVNENVTINQSMMHTKKYLCKTIDKIDLQHK